MPGPVAGPLLTADRFVAATAPVDYGGDILTFPDLDDTFTPINSVHAVLDALARRFVTRRGLLWNHPDYGRDLRLYLNGSIDTGLLAQMKSDVEDQAMQDERVDTASASVKFSQSTKTATVSINVASSQGPFSLVLAVSALSVDIISG